MQSGRELRETFRVFTILMVSKIRPRPSQAVELGVLGRQLLCLVPDGDNTNPLGSGMTARCLVLISVLEDGYPQEQWALSLQEGM